MKLFHILVALVMLAGPVHAASYVVTVNAMAIPGAKERSTYFLMPDDALDVRSLEHQQYERQLTSALTEAGFIEAENPENAEIALYFSYGIGEPQERTVAYSLPVWGQTGISSSQTTGTISTFGNTSTLSATTINTPTYGVTGQRTVVESETTYTRHLKLIAFDYPQYLESGEAIPVWDASMTSTGWSSVLSEIFPVLLSKSYQYFGTNMGKPKTFRVSDMNRAVRELRDSE